MIHIPWKREREKDAVDALLSHKFATSNKWTKSLVCNQIICNFIAIAKHRKASLSFHCRQFMIFSTFTGPHNHECAALFRHLERKISNLVRIERQRKISSVLEYGPRMTMENIRCYEENSNICERHFTPLTSIKWPKLLLDGWSRWPKCYNETVLNWSRSPAMHRELDRWLRFYCTP